jgi:hypothetical protein
MLLDGDPGMAAPFGPEVDSFRCTSPHYGRHEQIVECLHCRLVYANPRWSAAELVATYEAVEDYAYLRERQGRELTFRHHLGDLERFTGSGQGRSLLDVGAYIGVFVEVAAAAGWDAYGVEPSNWAVTYAQQQGLKVWQGTQHAEELSGRLFDVVTMWDVVEHFDDPAGEFRRSFELLRAGGWLAVHTMDIESPAARLMGPRWPWLMDMHLYYFSRRTLAKMLESAGFEVVWCGAQGRYLRLDYLATRLAGLNQKVGRIAHHAFVAGRIQDVAVPVNFGDLFTIYARRGS